MLVIGSSNIDLIAQVERFPQPGETIGNAIYSKMFGGKGANQAVAAVRAGGEVTFVTSVGDDGYASELKEHFKSNGINIKYLRQADNCPTGVALILVDAAGGNIIAVAPGANAKLTANLVEETLIESTDIILMQMEIPYQTVREIALLAKKYNTKVMLNPAPARVLDEELMDCVDYLVVNESEANLISGLDIERDGLEVVARKMLEMGSKMIIITLGKDGSYIYSDELRKGVKSYTVTAVDSTAAGDTFCGVLAVGISGGNEITEAVRFASAAAAISVTKLGAQDSIPLAEDIESFIEKNHRVVS
ncbi:MAG: ribokinase [Bacteroidales bacterium]|nr:ribokinase [Bacteroidales bacterium]